MRGKKNKVSWLGTASVVVIVVAVVAGSFLWFGQRKLIYFPDPTDPGSAAHVLPTGSDVVLTTTDGLQLEAWRIDPTSPNGLAVVYLPGNGGNRLGRADVGQALADEGFATVLVDYRGYGGNPGTPSEKGLLTDAAAALDYLNGAGYENKNIIFVGESIGTGVAVQLAAGLRDDPPTGILLRSPYTSMATVANHVMPIPLGWALRDRFDTLTHITNVTAPITVLAGDADTLIPPSQSTAVADAAPNLHDFTLVPGVDHNDPLWFGPFLAAKVSDLASSGNSPY